MPRHVPSARCLALSCGDSEADDERADPGARLADAEAAVIAEPSGYARYCSKVTGTSWDFVYDAGDSAPCTTASGSAFAIRRAGLWDNRSGAYNRVVVTCRSVIGADVREQFYGIGDSPLASAKSWATTHLYNTCTFTVAPRHLAIFQRPMTQSVMENIQKTGNGVDLAYLSTLAYDGTCVPAPGGNVQLDWKAHGNQAAGSAPYFPNNADGTPFNKDHSGYDWTDKDEWANRTGNAATWGVLAAAEGTVLKIRRRIAPGFTTCYPGGPNCQLEVFVRHTVGSTSSYYKEEFLSYYAHLDSAGVTEGQVLSKGDYIGQVGATGCGTCHEHLHFAVFRLTNTASEWRIEPLDLLENASGGEKFDQRTMIDPFGYQPNCADPWGAKFSDRGALSINLWQDTYGYLDWDHNH